MRLLRHKTMQLAVTVLLLSIALAQEQSSPPEQQQQQQQPDGQQAQSTQRQPQQGGGSGFGGLLSGTKIPVIMFWSNLFLTFNQNATCSVK